MRPAPFLTAKWQHLLMINYEVDPAVLTPFIPRGTQLDLWEGKAFVSLVGFLFLDTKVRGFSIPFHTNFEEVNLRFYIKRPGPTGERRAVAFIKEIVPRRGIAFLARLLYNEKYVAFPMRHHIQEKPEKITVEYQWRMDGKWQKMGASCHGDPQLPMPGSLPEFIAEHYFGYSVQRDGRTMEYEVQHPTWRTWPLDQYDVAIDVKSLYGSEFVPILEKPPVSSFLAEGSEIAVFKGIVLD